jgi:hypothetical protein
MGTLDLMKLTFQAPELFVCFTFTLASLTLLFVALNLLPLLLSSELRNL